MLLWELVSPFTQTEVSTTRADTAQPPRLRRLPYDTRCSGITKSGRRCRGKIRKGTDYCPFHDPALTAERRRRIAAKGGRSRNRLAHLPDGYLRKIKNRTDVGHCMDRLYREVRLDIVTPEMGAVMFDILCRLLDSGLAEGPQPRSKAAGRSKVDRFRPKLNELLSRQERAAWNQAIANAPAYFSAQRPRRQQAPPAPDQPTSQTQEARSTLGF